MRNGYWDHGEGFVVRVTDDLSAACVRFASEAGQPDVLGVDETGARVASAEHHTLDLAEVAAGRFVASTRIEEAPRALFVDGEGAVLVHTFAGALLRWRPDGDDGPRLVAARAVVSPTGRSFPIDDNPAHALWLDATRVVTSDGTGATVIDTATGTRQRLDLAASVALLATPDGALVVVVASA